MRRRDGNVLLDMLIALFGTPLLRQRNTFACLKAPAASMPSALTKTPREKLDAALSAFVIASEAKQSEEDKQNWIAPSQVLARTSCV